MDNSGYVYLLLPPQNLSVFTCEKHSLMMTYGCYAKKLSWTNVHILAWECEYHTGMLNVHLRYILNVQALWENWNLWKAHNYAPLCDPSSQAPYFFKDSSPLGSLWKRMAWSISCLLNYCSSGHGLTSRNWFSSPPEVLSQEGKEKSPGTQWIPGELIPGNTLQHYT